MASSKPETSTIARRPHSQFASIACTPMERMFSSVIAGLV